MQVYKGMLGFQNVAIKVVINPNPRHQKRFVHEIATLRACHDPHIVMFLGASIQEGQTLLVMQYMERGNLWEALANDTQDEFRWHRRCVSGCALSNSLCLAHVQAV